MKKDYSKETKIALMERFVLELILVVSKEEPSRRIIELPFDTNLNWLGKLISKSSMKQKK